MNYIKYLLDVSGRDLIISSAKNYQSRIISTMSELGLVGTYQVVVFANLLRNTPSVKDLVDKRASVRAAVVREADQQNIDVDCLLAILKSFKEYADWCHLNGVVPKF